MIHHYIIFFILLKTLKIELDILTLFFAIISLRMDDIFAFPSSCSIFFAISIAWTSFSLSASATAWIRSVSFNIFWVLCFCWATSCCVHSTYKKTWIHTCRAKFQISLNIILHWKLIWICFICRHEPWLGDN